MIQSSGHIAEAPGRPAASLRRIFILLRDEIVVGSPILARVGLIGLALAIQTVVLFSPGHFRPAGQWYFAALAASGTLLSLALCLAATLPVKRLLHVRVRQALGIIALLALGILSGMGTWHGAVGLASMAQGTPYNNDGAVMDLEAATQLRNGHNPYAKTSIVAALAAMDAPSTTTTPLMAGSFRGARAYPSAAAIQQVFLYVLRHRPHTVPPEFESKYNYPSGSFLFILPFVWAGMHDMRFLYALAVMGMGVYLWQRMPRSLRPLVPLLLLGNVPLVVLTSGGQPDPLYGFFLMVGYAEWSTPWLSPLSMGVAAGTKQLAWFFVPFYLVVVAREMGWREAARRLGLMAAIFAALNGPFIFQSPGAYVSSISAPMADPMFPLGIGIIALFAAGALPMLPKVVFAVMELAAWFGTASASAWSRYLTPATGAVLGALPLFFAWRSLVNYFYFVPILVLAVVLADSAQRRSLRRRHAQ